VGDKNRQSALTEWTSGSPLTDLTEGTARSPLSELDANREPKEADSWGRPAEMP